MADPSTIVPKFRHMIPYSVLYGMQLPQMKDDASMVLHIDGFPGSGKSTLMKQVSVDPRFAGFTLVDLDAINDKVKGDAKRAEEELDTILKKKRDKPIFLFGLTVDHVRSVATHGFFLKRTDLKQVVRDLNRRHLELILTQSKAIAQAIENNDRENSKLVHEFKLRLPFPVDYHLFVKDAQREEAIDKVLTYATGTADSFRLEFQNTKLSNLVNTPLIVNDPRRCIIHIAGSPGSGKTYIGEKLARLFANRTDILFRDIDDMFEWNPLTEGTPNDALRGITYRETCGKAIVHFLNKHQDKHVVLHGLTHYHAWDFYSGFDKGQTFSVHLDKSILKFFIDVNLDTLVARKFHRDVDVSADGIKQVLAGEKSINFSRQEIAQYTELERRVYEGMGYTVLPQDGVMDRVTAILSQTHKHG